MRLQRARIGRKRFARQQVNGYRIGRESIEDQEIVAARAVAREVEAPIAQHNTGIRRAGGK